MTTLTRRYHRDLGLPDDLAGPELGRCLVYSIHALKAAEYDGVSARLPRWLPACVVVEIETFGGLPVKWVVRCGLDTYRDLCLVVTSQYVVKTVWVNEVDDRHATLDITKYDRPERECISV